MAQNNIVAEDNVARRGIGGVDKRAELDMNEIDEEINKDFKTRKLLKVADYDFKINELNKFVSGYSPYKIFMEFIKLFKADTLEREEND